MSIAIKNLSFAYRGAEGFAFRIPELQLSRGRTYLLLGPSGSGKSTLLNLLAGILQAQSGTLEIAGQNMTDVGAAHMDRFRGEHIGFIFQSLNLIPWLSVTDNIALGLAFAPKRRQSVSGDAGQAIEELAQAMNIDATLMTSPAGQLSIGQQQRVAAARSLIGAPDIILASWSGKKVRPEKIASRDGWLHIPAVKLGHIYEIKSPLILQPGPAALTDGLDAICEVLS